jgi:hypothetical protein
VVWQLGLLLPLLFLFILFEYQIPIVAQVLAAMLFVVTLVNCGAILEQRKWIFYLEYSRYLLLLLLLLIYFPFIQAFLAIVLVSALPVVYFDFLKEKYLRQVYRW